MNPEDQYGIFIQYVQDVFQKRAVFFFAQIRPRNGYGPPGFDIGGGDFPGSEEELHHRRRIAPLQSTLGVFVQSGEVDAEAVFRSSSIPRLGGQKVDRRDKGRDPKDALQESTKAIGDHHPPSVSGSNGSCWARSAVCAPCSVWSMRLRSNRP